MKRARCQMSQVKSVGRAFLKIYYVFKIGGLESQLSRNRRTGKAKTEEKRVGGNGGHVRKLIIFYYN